MSGPNPTTTNLHLLRCHGAAASTSPSTTTTTTTTTAALMREQTLLQQMNELQRQLDHEKELNLDLQATIATIEGEARDSKSETAEQVRAAKEEAQQAKRDAAQFKAALMKQQINTAEQEREKETPETTTRSPQKPRKTKQKDPPTTNQEASSGSDSSDWEDEEEETASKKRPVSSAAKMKKKTKKQKKDNSTSSSSPKKKRKKAIGIQTRLNYDSNPLHKTALDIAVEAAIRKRNETTEDDPDLPPLPTPPPGAPRIPRTTLQHHVTKELERRKAIAAGIAWEEPKKRINGKFQQKWQDYLKQLVKFKEVFGHTNVPADYPKLGSWVNYQRYAYHQWKNNNPKKLGMNEDRCQQLEAIGFEWKLAPSPVPWEMRYLQLKEFKKQFKHCNVPQFYKENRTLGLWVKGQRRQMKFKQQGSKRASITDEQIAKLDALGFQWNILPPRKPGT